MSNTAGSDTTPLRIEELLHPGAFTHAIARPRLVETHISWIVLTGKLAYKIKKAVKLGFIDTSTLERRRDYCNEELRLNRRLAPEMYLRVVPITRPGGGQAKVDGDGRPIEYAVCMKQFSADQELPALLERRDVSTGEIEQLAELIARFHQQAPASSRAQVPENTQRMYDTVLENLEQLIEYVQRTQPQPDLQRLSDWTRAAIGAHECSFETRERTGHIRECHGDLHAANIVRVEQRLLPFDCIDFDPDLRWIDVMNDLAFLVMDLYSRGREDLSTTLLNRYLEITGDYDGARLLPFYGVHRALVRAKVDAIALEQSPHLAVAFTHRLQQRIRTAVQLMDRPRPVLLLMHGLSGSGKSWLSQQLVGPLRAVRVRSDLERKRLLGEPDSPAGAGFKQGHYAPAMSHRVYARLVECAESCLQAGCNVIVDAAFLEAADRELFTGLAERMEIACAFISCNADEATLLNRVAIRAADGKDVSEADRSVLAAQLRSYKPLVTTRRVIHADTREPAVVQTVVAAVRASIAAQS